jgi:hypothetical protein
MNVGGLRSRSATALRDALARFSSDVWPLLQSAAAATVAWVIASQLGEDRVPFFAPMAAVIAMNIERGERGLNALRLLSGVFIGIAAAELTLLVLGGGYGRILIATFLALGAARAIGGARIVMAQAGAGAILTVVTAGGEGGIHRLIDAGIGTGVALVFTQVLFSPEPIAMLRRAESSALVALANGLEMLSSALEAGDPDLGRQATDRLRGTRDQLVELARTRSASQRVARHSLVWRSRSGPLVGEAEKAEHLDLLVGSSVLLARASSASDPRLQRDVAPLVLALAESVGRIAADPGDRDARQKAADRALEVIRSLGDEQPLDRDFLGLDVALRLAATDLMVFAGVEEESAVAAVRESTDEPRVAASARSRRNPFRLGRRRGS